MEHFVEKFLNDIRHTTVLEYIAVFTGIASVWLSKKENILLYPVGLANTVIYTFLSIRGDLYGEASVNLYYTVVSIYGWIIWSRKNDQHRPVLKITYNKGRDWLHQFLFFGAFYAALYFTLIYAHRIFDVNTIPWADAFASATAYTGMWLMAKKKVQSWFWWIATDVASVPLYFVKGYAFTSVYYFILLIMAVAGWMEWHNRAKQPVSHIIPQT